MLTRIGSCQSCIAVCHGAGKKLIILVDAPTSPVKQITDLILNALASAQGADPQGWNFTLIVDVGSRVDILSKIGDTLRVNFKSQCKPITVMTTSGAVQHGRSAAPGFLLVVNSKAHADVQVPCMLQINRGSAHAWEQLRLRCFNAKCRLRAGDVASGGDEDVNAEMQVDDLEADDITMEVTEEANNDDEDMVTQAEGEESAPPADCKFKRNLWTFCRPLSRYEMLLQEIGKPDPWQHRA